MKKGSKFMKVLKIESKKCFYSTNGTDYNPIVDISKEDIFGCFDKLIHPIPSEHVYFIGLEVEEDV